MANVDLHSRSRSRGRSPSTAWVFSGGGVDGALQAGVVARAVELGHWHPGEISLFGTSTGAYTAVAASLWSGEPDLARRLRALWLAVARERLQSPRVQARLVDRIVPAGLRLEELPVPVSISVVDVDAGQLTRLRSGPVRESLLAASSWPLLNRPVEVEGRRFQDGGVAAYCDVLAADEAACSGAIAVACCNREPGRMPIRRSRAHGGLGLAQRLTQMERHLDASSMEQLRRDLLICRDRMPTLLLAPLMPPRGSHISNPAKIAWDLELGRALADEALTRPNLDILGRVARSADFTAIPEIRMQEAREAQGIQI